ncbi:hypothetical protein QAD02_022024 [Eretmocerus hayati]|uniref:Uncharacterized protein n=1 Tax=Eretmocerus hayati TaxID=131215 RepID=A0ACC2PRJ9_9HYME|nr:hypothetical protein QAD02_022024 [Eretmocerus hayati]
MLILTVQNERRGPWLPGYIQKCANPTTIQESKAKAMLGEGCMPLDDQQRASILQAVINNDSKKIPITAVSSKSSYAGIRVINKQDYIPPPNTPAPPSDRPNAGLENLLSRGFKNSLHALDEDALFRGVSQDKRTSLYCSNISFENISPAFVGYLRDDETIKSSHIHPSVNRLIGDYPGINTSFLYIAGNPAFGEMHVEDSNLASFNLVITNSSGFSQDIPSKFWIIVLDS